MKIIARADLKVWFDRKSVDTHFDVECLRTQRAKSFSPFIGGNGSSGTKNSAKVFSFVDSSDSSRVKSGPWPPQLEELRQRVQLERQLIVGTTATVRKQTVCSEN